MLYVKDLTATGRFLAGGTEKGVYPIIWKPLQ